MPNFIARHNVAEIDTRQLEIRKMIRDAIE